MQLLPHAVHLNKKIKDEYEAKTAGALGIGHLNRDGGLAKKKIIVPHSKKGRIWKYTVDDSKKGRTMMERI